MFFDERIKPRIRVDENGCWRWTGCKSPRGYASISKDGKVRSLHRLVYEIFKGPIPTGLQIDHLCRVRDCCNPEHLEAVTQQENLRRGIGPSAENARKTHCPLGHPYDWVTKKGRGCKTCKAASNKRYLEKTRTGRPRSGERTHCPHGHEYNEENTDTKTYNGKTTRTCIPCRKERGRKKNLEKKAQNLSQV